MTSLSQNTSWVEILIAINTAIRMKFSALVVIIAELGWPERLLNGAPYSYRKDNETYETQAKQYTENLIAKLILT